MCLSVNQCLKKSKLTKVACHLLWSYWREITMFSLAECGNHKPFPTRSLWESHFPSSLELKGQDSVLGGSWKPGRKLTFWRSFTLSSPSDSESASYLLSKLSASYWLSASMKSWFEYECYEAGSDWVLSVCWKEVHCICKARFSLAVVGEVLWKFGCCRRGSVEVWLL